MTGGTVALPPIVLGVDVLIFNPHNIMRPIIIANYAPCPDVAFSFTFTEWKSWKSEYAF